MTIPLSKENEKCSNEVTTVALIIVPIFSIIISGLAYIETKELLNSILLFLALCGMLSIMVIIAIPILFLTDQVYNE